jgi:hypothetical protein
MYYRKQLLRYLGKNIIIQYHKRGKEFADIGYFTTDKLGALVFVTNRGARLFLKWWQIENIIMDE